MIKMIHWQKSPMSACQTLRLNANINHFIINYVHKKNAPHKFNYNQIKCNATEYYRYDTRIPGHFSLNSLSGQIENVVKKSDS